MGRQLPGGQDLGDLSILHLPQLPGSLPAVRGLIHALLSRETPLLGVGCGDGRAVGELWAQSGDPGLFLCCAPYLLCDLGRETPPL